MNRKRNDDAFDATKRSLEGQIANGFFDTPEMRGRIAAILKTARAQESREADRAGEDPERHGEEDPPDL